MKKLIITLALILGFAFGGYAQQVDSTLYKRYLKDYKDIQAKIIKSDKDIAEGEKQLQKMKDANNSLRGSLNTIAFYLQQEKKRLDSLKEKGKSKKLKVKREK